MSPHLGGLCRFSWAANIMATPMCTEDPQFHTSAVGTRNLLLRGLIPNSSRHAYVTGRVTTLEKPVKRIMSASEAKFHAKCSTSVRKTT